MYCPDFCRPDYAFFSSSKRFDKVDPAAFPCPVILTSNLRPQVQPAQSCVVGYDRVAGTFAQGGNSVVMLLRLLAQCGAKAVLLAGAGMVVTELALLALGLCGGGYVLAAKRKWPA